MSTPLPAILLAFANDRQGSFLRSIAVEQDAISQALSEVEAKSLVNILTIASASAQSIVQRLNDHGDQVRIVHYGGHADGENLLLSSGNGNASSVNAGNFAEVLSHLPNLKLVFLNGCNTYQQAQALMSGGIDYVVVTDRAINDAAAKTFAEQFYTSLSKGANIPDAFERASSQAKMLTGAGDDFRSLYFDEQEAELEKSENPPWHLFTSFKADKEWTLTQTDVSRVKEEIKALIGGNKLKKAIALLKEHTETDTDLHAEVLTLAGRFRDLVKKERIGLISSGEATTSRAQITYGLIGIVDSLGEST